MRAEGLEDALDRAARTIAAAPWFRLPVCGFCGGGWTGGNAALSGAGCANITTQVRWWLERFAGQVTSKGEINMKEHQRGINPASKPSGDGCVECLASPKGWWFHLRRCAECGHIGCCDSSPGQHASKHAAATGHPIMTSFEPGEDWFYDYRTRETVNGAKLLPPHSHPESQPTPGPAGRVPANWESLLN